MLTDTAFTNILILLHQLTLLYMLQKPLDEALFDPELLVMTNYVKKNRHQTLHLAFQGLHDFVKREGRLPMARSQVSVKAYIPYIKYTYIFLAIRKTHMPLILSGPFLCFTITYLVSKQLYKQIQDVE